MNPEELREQILLWIKSGNEIFLNAEKEDFNLRKSVISNHLDPIDFTFDECAKFSSMVYIPLERIEPSISAADLMVNNRSLRELYLNIESFCKKSKINPQSIDVYCERFLERLLIEFVENSEDREYFIESAIVPLLASKTYIETETWVSGIVPSEERVFLSEDVILRRITREDYNKIRIDFLTQE